MNKKGFISVSVMYSFFLIFLLLLVFIVTDYATNRTLLNKVKNSIKSDINGTSEESNYFYNYIIKNVYTGTDGGNNIYFHDGFGNYGSYEAGDYSYRYVGSNPDNYVCFGYTPTSTCESNYLYRIIGVFEGKYVKIIKASGLGTSKYGTSNTSWKDTTVNEKLKEYFESDANYWNIGTSTWKDAFNYSKFVTKGFKINSSEAYNYKNIYDLEMTYTSNKDDTYFNYVGLLYISDYLYANDPNKWSSDPLQNSSITNNWLHSTNEWTITKDIKNNTSAYSINTNKKMLSSTITTEMSFRPVIYLYPQVKYKSGSGTSSSPYILEV